MHKDPFALGAQPAELQKAKEELELT